MQVRPLRRVRVTAHAKINLVLRVGPLRPDGYHEIDSVLHSIALHDVLSVEAAGLAAAADPVALEIDPPERLPVDDNLVMRAARALLQEAAAQGRAVTTAVRLRLEKRIPVGAGLGGGSADAAAALQALNAFWGLSLPQARLAALAARLGADVPFCLTGGAARARGYGEALDPLPPLPDWPLVLITFQRGLSTADVYRAFDRLGAPAQARAEPALAALRARDLQALAGALGNDLAPVVERLRPEVAEARRALVAAGALGAQVSGSGPTVFGLFADPETAQQAAARLAPAWDRVLVTRFSPHGIAGGLRLPSGE